MGHVELTFEARAFFFFWGWIMMLENQSHEQLQVKVKLGIMITTLLHPFGHKELFLDCLKLIIDDFCGGLISNGWLAVG